MSRWINCPPQLQQLQLLFYSSALPHGNGDIGFWHICDDLSALASLGRVESQMYCQVTMAARQAT